jgi:hypothetical protein
MRKLVTWLLVTLGIAALVRKLRRQQEPQPASETIEPSHTLPPQTPPPPPEAAAPPVETAPAETIPAVDPADELREKLARSRADMPSPEQESVEDRRASVYEQGRAALDEMRPSEEPAAEPTHEDQ